MQLTRFRQKVKVKHANSQLAVCSNISASLFVQLFTSGGSSLLEPIMQVEIVTTDESAPAVLADISRRRAEIKNVDVRGRNKVFIYYTVNYYPSFFLILNTFQNH